MADNTLRLIDEADLTWLHVFPYSARPGTPAARMPQVAGEIRRERAARLRAAGARRADAFLRAQIGRTVEALIELDGTGRTAHFAPVRPSVRLPARAIVPLRVEGVVDGRLVAGLVERVAA
jgi:threonylcarbamoyladenosine tRNA methylthiotransferase MtaB